MNAIRGAMDARGNVHKWILDKRFGVTISIELHNIYRENSRGVNRESFLFRKTEPEDHTLFLFGP